MILIGDEIYDLKHAILGQHYSNYAVCANCRGVKKDHAGSACLFGFSTFIHLKGKRHNGKKVPQTVRSVDLAEEGALFRREDTV